MQPSFTMNTIPMPMTELLGRLKDAQSREADLPGRARTVEAIGLAIAIIDNQAMDLLMPPVVTSVVMRGDQFDFPRPPKPPTSEEIRQTLKEMGADADRYIPRVEVASTNIGFRPLRSDERIQAGDIWVSPPHLGDDEPVGIVGSADSRIGDRMDINVYVQHYRRIEK